jgi:hypothetical protein
LRFSVNVASRCFSGSKWSSRRRSVAAQLFEAAHEGFSGGDLRRARSGGLRREALGKQAVREGEHRRRNALLESRERLRLTLSLSDFIITLVRK